MSIYKIVVKAERQGIDMFSGKEKTFHDTSERYIAAYSCDHALSHVKSSLERAGWKVKDMIPYDIYLHDIRDSCDHITD